MMIVMFLVVMVLGSVHAVAGMFLAGFWLGFVMGVVSLVMLLGVAFFVLLILRAPIA